MRGWQVFLAGFTACLLFGVAGLIVWHYQQLLALCHAGVIRCP